MKAAIVRTFRYSELSHAGLCCLRASEPSDRIHELTLMTELRERYHQHTYEP